MKQILILFFLLSQNLYASSAEDIYFNSDKNASQTLSDFLTQNENKIHLLAIHQGQSVSFEGDQGENFWMRQKLSQRFFILLRFLDGSRSLVCLENMDLQVIDSLYQESTSLSSFEDNRNKIFATLKSTKKIKLLLGQYRVKVRQLSYLEPMSVYLSSQSKEAI